MRVLAVNAGSSSLKLAMFEAGGQERRLFAAEASGIGAPSGGAIRRSDEDRRPLAELPAAIADHQDAISRLLPLIREHWGSFEAVGHRVVHGGAGFRDPVIITDAVRDGIHALEPIDPDHAAAALAGIDALRDAYPRLPQVACFDTAFHARMPTVARLLPLPRRFLDAGIVRYGFHGLSYEFVTAELRRLDPSAADGRVIVAHLGSGASMAAIRAGIGIDTTMGFTPAGGLMMGTRPGDIDPGVLVHLARAFDLDADQLNALVNREAGLLGVSGGIADMGELLELAERDRNASEAVALFCYTAKKHVGALCAVLGGVQTLAFTGGIGERAAPVRARICEGLDFLGIELDAAMNDVNAAVISSPGSRVCVRIIPTDEERMIARHTFDLVGRTRQDAL